MAQLSRVTKKILAQLSSVLFHRKLLISNLAQLSRELNYPEAQLSRVDCNIINAKFYFFRHNCLVIKATRKLNPVLERFFYG